MPDLGISVLLKGQNFMRMLAGLGVALKISLISVVISIPLGIVLGVLMTWKNPITKAILRIYLEIVRIMVRGALISIPKHQYESSEALGLSKVQTYWYIIIPQTLRRLIPLSINLITRMIKTTSLILMIGVVEVLKVSQQIIEANRMSSPNAAFGIYLVVFLLYFFACWPISMFAKYLERRWR